MAIVDCNPQASGPLLAYILEAKGGGMGVVEAKEVKGAKDGKQDAEIVAKHIVSLDTSPTPPNPT